VPPGQWDPSDPWYVAVDSDGPDADGTWTVHVPIERHGTYDCRLSGFDNPNVTADDSHATGSSGPTTVVVS